MKKIITFAFALSFQQVFSQLISGGVVDVNRRLLTSTDFTMKGTKEGVVVYDLAVDINGNISSETLVTSMTTIASTPVRMEVRNYLKTLKFEPGTSYPKFHHVTVKITIAT